MTSRFILRAPAGPLAEGGADSLLQQLQAMPGVQVLDRSPRMLLVCGEAAALQALLHACPGWTLMPETLTPRSDPLPRPRGKPPR